MYHIDGYDNSIVIDGFEKGIADDPQSGIADMRNIDIISIPKEASVAMSTQTMITQFNNANVTFTVNAATDTFTYNGVVPLEVNTAITVSNSGGALPAGLSANTAYYITSKTATTFQVSAISAGGATLDITGTGSGTNTFSTIQMGTPRYFTEYLWPFFSTYWYYYFCLDSNGRVWVYDNTNLGSSNKWVYLHNLVNESATSANGLQAYRGFLFKFNASDIDVIWIANYPNIPNLAYLSTAASWNFSWKTLLTSSVSTLSHQSLISNTDQNVYICNGQGVASIGYVEGSLASAAQNKFNIASTHTIATGVTTISSTTITTVGAFFSATDVGAVIVGTGIPTSAIITAVASSTSATISSSASATGSGLTFTITASNVFSAAVITLASNEVATCLAEIGDNLLIGGINNYVYPWDKVSPSVSQPIFLAESYVYRMVTVNTTAFIFVGERGRIWITNGSSAQMWKKIPDHLSGTVNPFYTWRDAVFNRNQLYFGFSVTDNTGTTINQFGGLWAIDVDTKALRLVNQLSYTSYSGYVSALRAYKGDTLNAVQTNNGYGLFIGWNDGNVGGIDKGIASPYIASQGVIVSDLIPVGTFDKPMNFERVEYRLSRPLVSGESIALYSRLLFNTQDTGFSTAILTDTTVGNYSSSAPVDFANAQWIQLKAVLSSTATNPSYVRLTQLRIKGKLQ